MSETGKKNKVVNFSKVIVHIYKAGMLYISIVESLEIK